MSSKFRHQQFRNANRHTYVDVPDIRGPREQDAKAAGFSLTVESAMQEAVQEASDRSRREIMARYAQDYTWPYNISDTSAARNALSNSGVSGGSEGQPCKMSVPFTPAPGPLVPPRSSLRYVAPGVYVGKEEHAEIIANQQPDPERDARQKKDRLNLIKNLGIHQARLDLDAEKARKRQASEWIRQHSDSTAEDLEVSADALCGSALACVRDKRAKDALSMLMQLQDEDMDLALDYEKPLDRPISAASTASVSTRPGSAVLRPTSAISYAGSASRPSSARTLPARFPARPRSAALCSAKAGPADSKPERRATHCSSFAPNDLVPEQASWLPSPPMQAPPERRRPQTARMRIAVETTVETQDHSPDMSPQPASSSQQLSFETLKLWYDAVDVDQKGFITRHELLSAINLHQVLFNVFCRHSLQNMPELTDLHDTQLVGGLRIGESSATGMLRQSLEKSQGHRTDEWSADGWAAMNQMNEYRFEVDDGKKEQLARRALAVRKSMDLLDRTHTDSLLRNAEPDVDVSEPEKCYRITMETLICYFQHQGLLTECRRDRPHNTGSSEQGDHQGSADIVAEQDHSITPEACLGLEEAPSQGGVAELEVAEHGDEDEAVVIAPPPVAPSVSFVDGVEHSELKVDVSQLLAIEVVDALVQKIPSRIEAEADDVPDYFFARAEDEVTGLYTLVRDAVVSPELELLDPDDDDIVDELVEGDQVKVVEVVELVEQQRLRARLQRPDGWITLLNRETGRHWAEKQRASHPAAEDGPGAYIIKRTAFVSPELTNCNPDDDELVDELEVGREIMIEEVVDLADAKRRRARLAHPHGWITLFNHGNGKRWAVKSARKIAPKIQEDKPGVYILDRVAFVSPEIDNFDPDDDDLVDELEDGKEVRIAEVVEMVHEQRLRARLEEPNGWITLANQETGKRWASPVPRDAPGTYIITRTAFVSPELENLAPDDDDLVDELDEGQEIRITEIVDLHAEQRLRGHVEDPEGWITILNKKTSMRSARRLADVDEEPALDEKPAAVGAKKDHRKSSVVPWDVGSLNPDFEVLDRLDQGPLAPPAFGASKQKEVSIQEMSLLWAIESQQKGIAPDTQVADPLETSAAIEDPTQPSEQIEDPTQPSEPTQDSPGFYTLTYTAFVSPDLDNINPDDDDLVAELFEGEQIKVLQLVDLVDQGRLRAKLEEPHGWITLLNKQTGKRWAVRDQSQLTDMPGLPSTGACNDLEDTPGPYILTQDAFVSPELNNLSPDDDELIDELFEGERIEILEIVELQERGRVRARLERPDGWITLMNRNTSSRWAERVEDQQPQMPEFAQQEDLPGPYILTQAVCVSAELNTLEPCDREQVAEIPEGSIIHVSEVVDLVPEQRLRARLESPAGWITLVNKASGKRSAETWVDLSSSSRKRWAEPWAGFSSSSNEEQRRMQVQLALQGQAEALPGLPHSPKVNRHEVKLYLQQMFMNIGHRGEQTCIVHEAHIDHSFHGDVVRLDADGIDSPGSYIVTRATSVSPAFDLLYPNDDMIVDELDEGREIRVVEVVDLVGHGLLRAKLDYPQGWITLVNTETGRRWADRFQTFRLEAQLPEQDDEPGLYLLMHPVPVSLELEQVQPEPEEIVAELDAGQEIWITEAVNFTQKNRVRAHVEEPDGWITLVNTATGWRSARKQQGHPADPADTRLAEPRESIESWCAADYCTYADDDQRADRGGGYHSSTDGETPLLDEAQNSDMDELQEARIQRPEDAATTESRVMTPTFGFRASPQPPLDEPQSIFDDYRTGTYLLLQSVCVSPESYNFNPEDEDVIAELPEDTEVDVIEVLYLEEGARVRALLHEPRGWITLENLNTGRQFAEPVDKPGFYLLLRTVIVSPSTSLLAPTEDQLIDELEAGEEVDVIEVVVLEREKRVRGRLHSPAGWITLRNLGNDAVFATRVIED